MDLFLLYFIVMVIVMWDPTKIQRNTKCWHVTTVELLFVLYKCLTMDWLNPKHVAKDFEREYALCFDWLFIPFSSIKKT